MPSLHAVIDLADGLDVGTALEHLGLLHVARSAGYEVVPRAHPAILRRHLAQADYLDLQRRSSIGLRRIEPLHDLPSAQEARLVFWGGRHHARGHLETVADLDYGDLDRAYGLLMAAGYDGDHLRNIQSFGTSLDLDVDLAMSRPDVRYSESLRRLLKGSGGAWFGDVASADLAGRVEAVDRARAVVDVAWFAERPRTTADGEVAVFLNGDCDAHAALKSVARWLTDRYGTSARWLAWRSHSTAADAVLPSIPGLRDDSSEQPSLQDILEQLARAPAVVTDSDRLARVAWAWGIPAVTVPCARSAGTVRGADGFEVPMSAWADPDALNAYLDRLAGILDTGVIHDVAANIRAEVAIARGELLASWANRPGNGSPAASPAAPPAVAAPPVMQIDVADQQRAQTSVTVAAVLSLRDEVELADGAIAALVREGIDVVVLGHGLSDQLRAVVDSWVGRGVIDVREWPFDGTFSRDELLRRKEAIAAELRHEWVLLVDADEWLCSPRDDERLIDLIGRADAAGDTVVNFEEFVFVPDVELAQGEDPRQRFLSYYFYRPAPRRLMRAWRRDADLSGIASRGHTLIGSRREIHGEEAVLRHYPVLNPEHGARKYADQAPAGAAGFASRPGPALRRIADPSVREMDRSAPTRLHYWQPQWDTELAGTAIKGMPTEARSGYALCATRRSGTTYLCAMLRATHVLGNPVEYFSAPGRRFEGDAGYPDDPEAQVDRILVDGVTANGVYGVKIFPEQFDAVAATKWVQRLPQLRYVLLTRKDVLRQAVSLARARQTEQWSAMGVRRREATYDHDLIATCMSAVVADETRWRLFFARNGIVPLELTYEQLVVDPSGALRAIGELVGLSADTLGDAAPEVAIAVQRDDESESWRERFLQEASDPTFLDRPASESKPLSHTPVGRG